NDTSLQKACTSWSLTPEQVQLFFELSEEYKTLPYSEFYQVPCSISGKITFNKHIWHYKINGGGTAVSTDGKGKRYWGCKDPKCATLICIPTDMMRGE